MYAASPTISVKKKSKISGSGSAYSLQKAINTSTGETLINFVTDYGGFDGVRISPKGKALGKPSYIAETAHNDFFCCFLGSTIAYNPALQEYFAAYSPWYTGATGSILAVHLDIQGKVKGKEITILDAINPPKPNDLGDNSYPHLIFNPKTNGYIMIWERTEGIAAALLDENGKLTSPIKIIKQNPGSNGFYDDARYLPGRIEDVQWLASGKKLLVVFQQRFTESSAGLRAMDVYSGQADYWLAVLDPLLTKSAKVRKINTDPLPFAGGWSANASLGILPDDTACVFYPDNEVVWGRTINRKGKFTSEPFSAFSGSIAVPLYSPKVAFSTTSAGTVGLLVAYEATPLGVAPQNAWAQTLDDHGLPTGEAKIVDTFINEIGTGALLFALPGKPSNNSSQFIWLQSRWVADIFKLILQVTP